jgi:hypothetical protein
MTALLGSVTVPFSSPYRSCASKPMSANDKMTNKTSEPIVKNLSE